MKSSETKPMTFTKAPIVLGQSISMKPIAIAVINEDGFYSVNQGVVRLSKAIEIETGMAKRGICMGYLCTCGNHRSKK